ncbi:hypothetical protein BVRB_9g213300 [Beta vulgaris subsp. vulgaris]|uniref:F-box protein SKIP23 n=1 Tax=Beta vulgaris subsp. vulgaris TaxID=3555 RepID=UPI000540094A|nr:F-box protein SKIP23 [Beta vulgaris subsp. vulgaris]KMT01314.1 hypothetical protein BVRB_9g213300 [Beta vulgaris subsp. vulgaris]
MAADWSELPSELLELIFNLTNTSLETRHFRSVCSSWRSSVPAKQPTTHFLSPPIKLFNSEETHNLDLRLVKQSIFLVSLSSDPDSCWVIKTEENKTGVLRLLSPFSKRNFIKHLNCNALDLTNVDVFEIGCEYVLRNINKTNDHMMRLYDMENEKVTFSFLGKNDFTDNFVILSTQNSTGKLLMYKSCLQEWAVLDDVALGYEDRGEFCYDWSVRYVDVLEYEGKFYAVTDSGRTVVIEIGDDFTVVVNLMVKSIIGGDKKCLVKSGADLLLVDMYTCSDTGSIDVNAIDVFKLDKVDKRWVLLKSLENRSIFLSTNSSFSANSLHGLKENCIYFSFKNLGNEKKDGNVEHINEAFCDEEVVGSDEIGVFDYEKGIFKSLEENFEDSELFCWQPPSWINLLT